MILADTSAWVEYDRATGSPFDTRLTNLIADDGHDQRAPPALQQEPRVGLVLGCPW